MIKSRRKMVIVIVIEVVLVTTVVVVTTMVGMGVIVVVMATQDDVLVGCKDVTGVEEVVVGMCVFTVVCRQLKKGAGQSGWFVNIH